MTQGSFTKMLVQSVSTNKTDGDAILAMRDAYDNAVRERYGDAVAGANMVGMVAAFNALKEKGLQR